MFEAKGTIVKVLPKSSGITGKGNMWITVEKELPDVDKPCFVITKNNKCSVSNMYIPKDCYGNTLGEKEWKGSSYFKESIVDWMRIPEFKKGK